MYILFFFCQKTAYGLRIRDWSSDGCPSDRAADQHLAVIAPAGAEGLPATVGAVVYKGTDTTYRLALADGTPFLVRAQNNAGARLDLAAGAAVTVQIAPAAIQRPAD